MIFGRVFVHRLSTDGTFTGLAAPPDPFNDFRVRARNYRVPILTVLPVNIALLRGWIEQPLGPVINCQLKIKHRT